jgi:hypothetical protein
VGTAKVNKGVYDVGGVIAGGRRRAGRGGGVLGGVEQRDLRPQAATAIVVAFRRKESHSVRTATIDDDAQELSRHTKPAKDE